MKSNGWLVSMWMIAAGMWQSGVAQVGMEMKEWIDLTYPFSEKTLYWPNNPTGFEFDTLFEGHTEKGFYYSSFSFHAPENVANLDRLPAKGIYIIALPMLIKGGSGGPLRIIAGISQ